MSLGGRGKAGRPKARYFPGELVVPIIGDAMYGSGLERDGRLVPALALDTSRRPEVAELIRVQSLDGLGIGDVTTQWFSSPDDADVVGLALEFLRPVVVKMFVELSIERQALLVEGILQAEAVYVQVGHADDDGLSRLNAPKVLVEVAPHDDFRTAWPVLLEDRMTVVVKKQTGSSSAEARAQARKVIGDMQALVGVRLKSEDG